MADEQNWDAYANQAFLASTDTLLARTAAGAGVEISGSAVAAKRSTGEFTASDEFHVNKSVGPKIVLSHELNAADGAGAIEYHNRHNATSQGPEGQIGANITFSRLGSGNIYSIAFGISDPENLAADAAARWEIYPSSATSYTFRPVADNTSPIGGSSNRVSTVYAGTGTINTSDEREKRDIGAVPDEWLDAWGDVEWQRFKFKDGSRWHIGLIAQRVHAAFAARDLDAFEIGLCCYDEWEPTEEPVIGEDGNPTGETKLTGEAGDLWGLRYDECFAMEAAWNRREMARAAQKHEELEAKLQALIEQAGS